MSQGRETLEFDVVVVGGGPAGLAAAIRLRQLCRDHGDDFSVCVVEKGSEIGAHILSGAVIEPRALSELFPDWRERGAPLHVAVADDSFYWLHGERRALRVPHFLLPAPMRNRGNYIASLGALCRWLGEQAEALGADILPGFAAADLLIGESGQVAGVVTGDRGVAADGSHKDSYEAGYELRGKYVIFAEGCRGHLGKRLEQRFALRADAGPQHYGIGLKEVWQVDPLLHRPGEVVHTLGWPLDDHTDGGGFLYHADDQKVYLGLVVALNYSNPYLDPFAEFQRWKQHPKIRHTLEGGKRISYGARALNKGGLQALPKLTFPGGLLAGCEAGFLNGVKIKGSHTALKSGSLAAEVIYETLSNGDGGGRDLLGYGHRIGESWLYDELYRARNFNPALARFGTLAGAAFTFVDQNVFRGRLPFTLRNPRPDHQTLLPADQARRIDYPKPDGVISFDRSSSVFLSNTHHEENQPCHLHLADPDLPVEHNLPVYDAPSRRYCPAGVYEILTGEDGQARFQINAANCVHCKTCDIKDPRQNIEWVPPEGGGGPNYPDM